MSRQVWLGAFTAMAAAAAAMVALTVAPAPDAPPQPVPNPPPLRATSPAPAPTVVAAPPKAVAARAPEPELQPAQATAAAPEPVLAAAPRAPEPALGATPAAPQGAGPEIDLVRVDRAGSGLIAGRAAPGARVVVMADAAPVAEAEIGADGQFALFVDLPPSARPRAITLAALDAEGAPARHAAPVILAPTIPPPPAAAADPAPAAVAPDAATPFPAAAAPPPLALRASENGVDVLQRPRLAENAPVALDALSYDAAGAARFQGRARPGATVRVTLDGDLAAETRADAQGEWLIGAQAVIEPGDYTLLVEERDAGGALISRVESPFRRDAQAQGAPGPGEIVVQPGATLWGISFARYGNGARYAVIVEANRALIANPDLIFPGQVFVLPEAVTE